MTLNQCGTNYSVSILGSYLQFSGDPKFIVGMVESTVAGVFDVDVQLLHGASRGQARVALARQVSMYIAHCAFRLSHAEVGRLFERDRSTVSYACSSVEDRRDDPRFDRTLFQLEEIVRRLWRTSGVGLALDVAI